MTTPELEGMTWDRWKSMPQARKADMRDTSDLHQKLRGWEGQRVTITPKPEYYPATFTVGISTGWKPIHMVIRNSRQHGSSEIIGPDMQIDHVEAARPLRRR